MKTLALILTIAAAGLLAACENSSTTAAPADSITPRGTPLGNSNVRVSGDIDAGGTLHAR